MTRRRIVWLIVSVLLALIVYYRELLVYAAAQGWGQITIIRKARPVDTFLNDPGFPDSLKAKLQLIKDARVFAIDSLGLKDTDNYHTMFDQDGKEIMWVVIACEPFSLKGKYWDFPIVGSVPYKGFFEKEKAIRLRDELEKEGYDVVIRNPGAWSTLGWFNDPILSGMLKRSDGDLASLIIHEMVHATLFVKDDPDFNENLASFIGDRGAEKFLAAHYGDSSKQLITYMQEDADYRLYAAHMLRASKKLDSVYTAMPPTASDSVKREIKNTYIRKIISALDTLKLSTDNQPSKRFEKRLPNNAFFLGFLTYESRHDEMMDVWSRQYGRDLKRMIRGYQEAGK